MDSTDEDLLRLLASDARRSLTDLAQETALSPASVKERLRRLQSRGQITAFTIDTDPAALGFTLQALVRIRPAPGADHRLRALIEAHDEVVECDKVTGEDCYVARVHVSDLQALDVFVGALSDMATTHTAIVKSQPIKRRPLIRDAARKIPLRS